VEQTENGKPEGEEKSESTQNIASEVKKVAK
jgi:hypothetical protein